ATRARAEIPALAMLAVSAGALERRARALAEAIQRRLPDVEVTVEPGAGEVGGGALPLQRLRGWVVALAHRERTANELDRWARAAGPPVVRYLRRGKLRMDA